jgi:hypothetical protein
MPDLDALRSTEDPAITVLRDWVAAAACPVELLAPADPSGATLLALQVTRHSMLGALADDTGGLLVDHGWLRHLGGGCPRLPRTLASWNLIGSSPVRLPGAMLVADDVLGGFFAINAGGLPGAIGNVCYFAPDTLDWEDLEAGHTTFVQWTLSGRMAQFYESERWPGWERDVATLRGDQSFSIFPFLWTAGPPIEQRNRKAVLTEDLWGVMHHVKGALQAAP